MPSRNGAAYIEPLDGVGKGLNKTVALDERAVVVL